jgi:SAM-dependent methyltransferase
MSTFEVQASEDQDFVGSLIEKDLVFVDISAFIELLMTDDMSSFDKDSLSKLQALFRGRKTRDGAYKRAKEGATILCPFLASPPSVLEATLSLMNFGWQIGSNLEGSALLPTCQGISPESVFFDLGCGDGTMLIGIARATGAKCIGVEIDNTLCRTARRRAAEAGVGDIVEVQECDLAAFTFGANSPTVVFAFLVPSCLTVLSRALFRSLASGTLLILYKFPLPAEDGWTPLKEVVVEDAVKAGAQATVYLYKV